MSTTSSFRSVNNENDVPIDVQNPRPLKTFRVMNDNVGRAEKRPRGLYAQVPPLTKPSVTSSSSALSTAASTTAAVRRTVLGDVTNKINIKKSTTMAMLQQKKMTKIVKRTYPGVGLTTPVVNTFGSMALQSPMCGPPAPQAMDPIKESPPPAPKAPSHDIDSEDKNDATACWQYAEDLTKYHLETEKQRMPSPSFMARQSDINSKMRGILIDWLVDVHCKYDLAPQTLHIAVHLIDRHLAKTLSVPRQRLQLVGVAALFIASKYEEIYPPEAKDFVRITDNAYTKEELFAMEVDILSSVGYRVTFPTAYQFMKRFLKASRTCDDRVEHFSHYVIDRSLQEYKLIKHPPSRIAAAAVHIARTQMNDLPAWSKTLEHHSSYTETNLHDCIEDLKEVLWNAQNGVGRASKLSAVRRKFEKERFMGVASHPLNFDDAL